MSCAYDHHDRLPQSDALRRLQTRVDAVLAGTAATVPHFHEENRRLFAAFVPTDQQRASALAAAWMKMADELGGERGLERAIDHMYESLRSNYPIGMVKYAAELFLTHYAPARELLATPSLECVQPGAVQPSGPQIREHDARLAPTP